MDLLQDLIYIITHNIIGFIVAVIVFLFMRIKLVEERNKAYYKGRSDTPDVLKEQIEHQQKLFDDYMKRVDVMSRDLNHAFRCGIIKGISFESKVPANQIKSAHLLYAFDNIGKYNYYSRMPINDQFKREYSAMYQYDEEAFIEDYRDNLNYAYQAGIVEGVIYEYDIKGNVCSDELILSALSETKEYYQFRKNSQKINFVDKYINK